jgi:tetratricopeptide (TPR) repeat protein
MGLLWFFLTLAPTNSLISRFDLLSERNLYLPSIGLFLAMGSLLAGAVMNNRRAVQLLPVVVVILLMLSTHNRNMVYADQVTFWSDAASKSPRKARAHNNAGYAYQLAGDLDRAIDHFRTALSLKPDFAIAQENLRLAWEQKKTRVERRQH